jgi:rubrerythrin
VRLLERGNIFEGSEIVEIGIQIEKNGRDFYATLAENSTHTKAKEVFGFLAGEEEKHIQIFQKIFDTTQRYEPPESYPGEYLAYMRALADECVFTRKDQGGPIAKNTKDANDALLKGIGFEKDSIVFYGSMKKVVAPYDHNVIDELISQEQKHLQILLDLKSALS